ncbi:NEP1-interacting protein 1 [Amborella trichopoda]|uniref:RING-type domain-containing protein n=1 Tax=Amborella trichopoda TaxID=13333 RepID=W1PKI1_AMBTC|nr:NEP1-interacting protein 1 [Amborella trichopoda]ERN08229.1 hypothetical protein AMTR_s00018p00216050 [Amborella trichopoda]|eukprot:XP_006846554.1 NEP1-interacting protein 1 [Amborella trichopoda]
MIDDADDEEMSDEEEDRQPLEEGRVIILGNIGLAVVITARAKILELLECTLPYSRHGITLWIIEFASVPLYAYMIWKEINDVEEDQEEMSDDEGEMNTKWGLAPEVINNIPTSKIGSDTLSSPFFSKKCSCIICLEGFMKEEVVKKLHICLHIFHGACVDKWLDKANYCPYCRRSIMLS